jgi:type IV pilus assembly protein PilO
MAIDLNPYFDKIANLRKIHRVIIFMGTVVVLIGIFIFLIYIPKTGNITTLKTNIDTLESEIIRAKIRTKDLQQLEAEEKDVTEKLNLALKLLPTSSEIPSLLTNITKLGNDSNLEFLLFSPEKEVPKELYVEIPVSVEVKGNYHNVAQFFDKVGKLDRIVNVIDINMVPIEEYSTSLRTICKAITYRFKPEESVKSEPKKK